MIPTIWHVISNSEGLILAVYGAALKEDAEAKAKAIATQTKVPVYLHSGQYTDKESQRPHVGRTISMRGEHTAIIP